MLIGLTALSLEKAVSLYGYNDERSLRRLLRKEEPNRNVLARKVQNHWEFGGRGSFSPIARELVMPPGVVTVQALPVIGTVVTVGQSVNRDHPRFFLRSVKGTAVANIVAFKYQGDEPPHPPGSQYRF